jgi:hypothetical protein
MRTAERSRGSIGIHRTTARPGALRPANRWAREALPALAAAIRVVRQAAVPVGATRGKDRHRNAGESPLCRLPARRRPVSRAPSPASDEARRGGIFRKPRTIRDYRCPQPVIASGASGATDPGRRTRTTFRQPASRAPNCPGRRLARPVPEQSTPMNSADEPLRIAFPPAVRLHARRLARTSTSNVSNAPSGTAQRSFSLPIFAVSIRARRAGLDLWLPARPAVVKRARRSTFPNTALWNIA